MNTPGFNCELAVEGMHCAACELTIEREVRKLTGVQDVDAVLSLNKIKLLLAEGTDVAALKQQINTAINDNGYKLVDTIIARQTPWSQLGIAFAIAAIIVSLFIMLQRLGIANIVSADQMSLPVIFMIGIVASLSTCMAVVGGLVLTISSSYALQNKGKTKPLILFHLARLIGFFILGGVIGLLGSAFTLSPATIFIMNTILFGVMVIMGLNMLEVFPGLRQFQLHMPNFIGAGSVGRENISGSFMPLLLGVITFFLPCGFTQSMQVYSLTTGSFISGALTMFVFALGTFPVLALISFASTKLSKGLNSGLFFKTAGFLILLFAIFNFIGALAAIGLIQPVFNF
jgi:sulfite exporter TauE/SafE/copper chaperone CopZ